MGTFLQRWRLPLLCTLLLLSVAYNLVLGHMAPPVDTDVSAFIVLWLLAFLPYLAACLLILCTRASSGYRQWVELLVVLGGALLLRGILLPIEPDLSHDSWRYLWDARVTLHGYSPYVYAPGDPQLLPLRDDFLYGIIRFRNVPTLYPPVAQGFYLLSYLLAPANLVVFKVLLTICEIVSCCALAWLLKKRGSDPARCVIYAWAPLPIIEFAIQGHIDALTIMLMLLTVVCAQSTRRGSRVLTGVLLALAALTKIYPVLLLAVFLRKRDWALLASCITTILLAYVPYIVLGHGQILGFFATYASERTSNAGIIMQVINWLAMTMHLDIVLTMILIYVLDLALVGSAALIVLRLRQGERISVEAGILVLIGAIFAAASHIFPWYTAALLPWVALYTHQQSAHKGQYRSNSSCPGVAPRTMHSQGQFQEDKPAQGAHKEQYQSNSSCPGVVPRTMHSQGQFQEDKPAQGAHKGQYRSNEAIQGAHKGQYQSNEAIQGAHKGQYQSNEAIQGAHKGQYQSNEAIQGAHKGQYQSNKPYRTGVRPYRAPTRDAPTMVRTRIIGRARTIVGASLVGALEWYCPACLAVCTAWYFSSASILGYLFDGKVDWSLYYLLAYDLSLLALGLAFQSRTGRKRTLASFCLPRGKVYTSNTNESNRNA